MAHAPLCFAHAGGLRLDQPLKGVGRLPPEARRIAEDASLLAFERLVQSCLERDVEFLLIAPVTVRGSLTPHQRSAVGHQMQRLAEAGIPVFWRLQPDEAAADGWPQSWPDNVSFLTCPDQTSSYVRSGRVIATISAGRHPADADRGLIHTSAVASSEAPLRIAVPVEAAGRETDGDIPRGCRDAGDPGSLVAGFDYVALSGARRPMLTHTGSGLAHDPGPIQGCSWKEPGGGGFSIIEVDPAGRLDVMRVPAAPVRWERCLVDLKPDTDRDELIERLQLMLIEREPAMGEQLWLVQWVVVGSGPLFRMLEEEDFRDELAVAVNAVFDDRDQLQRVHQWELRPRATGGFDVLAAPLREWFEGLEPADWRTLQTELVRSLEDAGCPNNSLIRELTFEDVREAAAHWALRWLAGTESVHTWE